MSHPKSFFVDLSEDNLQGTDPYIRFSKTDNHHIKNVLRLKEGDLVCVSDRHSSRTFQCKLIFEEGTPTAEIILEKSKEEISQPVISLCTSFLKGSSNDLVCEKATELGVSSVIFFHANRSVMDISEEKCEKKLQRWKRISEEASKQCHRKSIPEILVFNSLENTLFHLQNLFGDNDLGLFCSLSKNATPIHNVLKADSRVHIFVGPEGDFTDAEEQFLLKNNARAISLGSFVLRSETAAVASVCMVQSVWRSLIR